MLGQVIYLKNKVSTKNPAPDYRKNTNNICFGRAQLINDIVELNVLKEVETADRLFKKAKKEVIPSLKESFLHITRVKYESALGKTHSKLVAVLNELGNFYKDHLKMLEAEECYLKSVEIQKALLKSKCLDVKKETLNKDYSKLISTLESLQSVYKAQSDFNAERKILRQIKKTMFNSGNVDKSKIEKIQTRLAEISCIEENSLSY